MFCQGKFLYSYCIEVTYGIQTRVKRGWMQGVCLDASVHNYMCVFCECPCASVPVCAR